MKISRTRPRSQNSQQMERAIRRTISSIPRGKIATYGQVAAAAGYPNYHRQVAQILRKSGAELPWHRVLAAGGRIACSREGAFEQRMRLEIEGVRFRGPRADIAKHQHVFKSEARRPRADFESHELGRGSGSAHKNPKQ